VRTDEGCLLIVGRQDPDGYARYGANGDLVHRLIWEAAHGNIPEGMVIHHRCHVRNCGELTHLELMTREQNTAIRKPRKNAGLKVCIQCKEAKQAYKRCRPCRTKANARKREREGRETRWTK
jgi:HNH endonuclease